MRSMLRCGVSKVDAAAQEIEAVMAAFMTDDVGPAFVARPLLPTRPGLLWRRALGLVRRQLEQEGMAPERAEQAGESALVACALHHDPGSVDEAYRLLLGRARRPGVI